MDNQVVKDFMAEMVNREMTDNPANLDYQDPKEKLEPPEFLARKETSESVKLEEMVYLASKAQWDPKVKLALKDRLVYLEMTVSKDQKETSEQLVQMDPKVPVAILA